MGYSCIIKVCSDKAVSKTDKAVQEVHSNLATLSYSEPNTHPDTQ